MSEYETEYYEVVEIPPREVRFRDSDELHNWATINKEHGTEEGTYMSLPGAIFACVHMTEFMAKHNAPPEPENLDALLN